MKGRALKPLTDRDRAVLAAMPDDEAMAAAYGAGGEALTRYLQRLRQKGYARYVRELRGWVPTGVEP